MATWPESVSRVLVTGSRGWRDVGLVERALVRAFALAPEAVLVHGACRGVDVLAAGVWERLGGRCEAWPAEWEVHGRAAGPIRNAQMVESGVDVCLAFILAGSRGASHCARLAEESGVVTFRFNSKEVA